MPVPHGARWRGPDRNGDGTETGTQLVFRLRRRRHAGTETGTGPKRGRSSFFGFADGSTHGSRQDSMGTKSRRPSKRKNATYPLIRPESLAPVERAAYLLRRVFDYGYDEIARI